MATNHHSNARTATEILSKQCPTCGLGNAWIAPDEEKCQRCKRNPDR